MRSAIAGRQAEGTAPRVDHDAETQMLGARTDGRSGHDDLDRALRRDEQERAATTFSSTTPLLSLTRTVAERLGHISATIAIGSVAGIVATRPRAANAPRRDQACRQGRATRVSGPFGPNASIATSSDAPRAGTPPSGR